MQKNWVIVFNFKVTLRAYVIKIGLFLLCLLKCWSICKQTWFDSTASYTGVSRGKIGITVFKVKVTAKVQNVRECLSGWCCCCGCFEPSQNILLPNLIWWCGIVSQSVMQEKIVCYLKVKVTARAHMIKICLLVWWCFIRRQSVLWKKKRRLLHIRSRSQWRFKTLLNLYLLNNLFILYLLHRWSLGYHSRCADLLLIITKPSTTK